MHDDIQINWQRHFAYCNIVTLFFQFCALEDKDEKHHHTFLQKQGISYLETANKHPSHISNQAETNESVSRAACVVYMTLDTVLIGLVLSSLNSESEGGWECSGHSVCDRPTSFHRMQHLFRGSVLSLFIVKSAWFVTYKTVQDESDESDTNKTKNIKMGILGINGQKSQFWPWIPY